MGYSIEYGSKIIEEGKKPYAFRQMIKYSAPHDMNKNDNLNHICNSK